MKIVKLDQNIVNRIDPVLLEFLRKNNCLSKFVNNVRALRADKKVKFCSIIGSFVFRETPEGLACWKGLQIKFNDYRIQK